MQCPNCGLPDLKETFKWCPECRFRLQPGQSNPHGQGKIVPNSTGEQPRSDAARGHDFGDGKGHVEGKLCHHGW